MSSAERRLSQNLQMMSMGLERAIEKVTGEKMGHILIVEPTEQIDIAIQWCSNLDRASKLAALRTVIEALESGMPAVALHEVQ